MASHSEIGLKLLHKAWGASVQSASSPDSHLAELADRVFGGSETGYKKAIVIQAAGKAADPELDAQAMQKGERSAGSWDAREFAKQTFVKWNLAVNAPFSHSTDPYVSNPYRVLRFDESQRSQRQKKLEFDSALGVLEYLNRTNDAAEAFENLVEVLRGLRRWIADKDVAYPLPLRASMPSVMEAIKTFLSLKSGGSRLQATVAALISSLSAAGFQIAEIASAHVNASDKSSQRAGDISYAADDRIAAVEVKDKPLTQDELQASIDKARVASVTDLLFVIRSDTLLSSDLPASDLERLVDDQFSSGLNVYVESFADFSRICLALIGEAGRRKFLEEVGKSLPDQGADISHKWDWAGIVKSL